MMRSLSILLLCFLFACGGTTDSTVTEEETTEETSTTENTAEDESTDETTIEEGEEGLTDEEIDAAIPMLISKGSFYGVQIGDNLNELVADQPEAYESGLLQTGEGDFPVVHILDENGEAIGDIFPGDDDKVDMIYVYTDRAETENGLKVGKTFEDILALYPDAVPHGSEIEGQVSVEVDGIGYKLDENIYEYDIDMSTFNTKTKIITIIL